MLPFFRRRVFYCEEHQPPGPPQATGGLTPSSADRLPPA
jgi:hypothetical protein